MILAENNPEIFPVVIHLLVPPSPQNLENCAALVCCTEVFGVVMSL
jgi:hypothetical protein